MGFQSHNRPLLMAMKLIWGTLDNRAQYSLGAGVLAMVLSGSALAASAALLASAVTPASGEAAAPFLALAICTGVAAQALDVVKWRCHADAELRLEKALTQFMFEAGLRSRVASGVGGQMQACANALLGCRLVFQHTVFTAPTAIIAAAGASVLLAGLGHLAIAAALAAFASIYLLAAVRSAKPMVQAAHRASGARIETGRRFGDGLANREVVRAFRAAEFIAASLTQSLRRVVRFNGVLASLRARASALGVLIYGAGLSGVMWLAWHSAGEASERTTLLVLVSVTMTSIMRPMEMAAGAFRDLIWARALVAPLIIEVGDLSADQTRSPAPVEVRLECVSVGYHRDRHVLKQASLICPPGSHVGLAGQSGVGKSTLIRLLTGELRPETGAVLIGGSPAPGRATVAVALQEVLLLDDTIRRNIAFGRTASEAEMRRATALVGLDELLSSLPAGLDSRVGERGMRLSGGERQRVALARAMLKPAALYLFDEATSALPPEAESAVMKRIVASAGAVTMIVVSHRESAFTGMDRVVALCDGAFSERGLPASRASAHTDPPCQGTDLQSPAAKT